MLERKNKSWLINNDKQTNLHYVETFLTLKFLRINGCNNHQQAQLIFTSCILEKRCFYFRICIDKKKGTNIYSLQIHTSVVVKNLITSFIPASPKTRSCSSCPSSRSPDSLIVLLIFPAIYIIKPTLHEALTFFYS